MTTHLTLLGMKRLADESDTTIIIKIEEGRTRFNAIVLNGCKRLFAKDYDLPNPKADYADISFYQKMQEERAYRIVFEDCVQRGFIYHVDFSKTIETEYDAYYLNQKQSLINRVKNSFKKRFAFIYIFGASK